MAIGDFLLKIPASDKWSNSVMVLVLLFSIIGSLFIVAYAAPQDIRHIIQAVFFGISAAVALVALLFVSKAGTQGLVYIAGLGDTKKTAYGVMAGIITFTIFVMFLFIFDSSNTNPANILPIGAIVLPDVQNLNIAYVGVFAPIIETIFFVGFVFYSLLNVVKTFEFTRRIAYAQPFLTFLVLSLFVASIFTIYHLYAYSQSTLGTANYMDAFVEKLIRIWTLCILWIGLTQATGSIAAPITMHIIQNWYAVSDLLKGLGVTVGILDLFLFIFMPLFLLYMFVKIVTPMLPRAPARF